MHIRTHSWLWPFSASTWHKRVIDDADRLSAEFGSGAHAVAADRSWREDVGLIKTRDSGHWARVTLEIGRRDARTKGNCLETQGVTGENATAVLRLIAELSCPTERLDSSGGHQYRPLFLLYGTAALCWIDVGPLEVEAADFLIIRPRTSPVSASHVAG